MLLNEKLPSQVWEFSAENCPNGSLEKVAKFHTNPHNFLACVPNQNLLPNPYKLYFWWYLKSYHFAIFLLWILLFLLKTLKFSWSFIWIFYFFKQTENDHTLPQSSHVSAMGYALIWQNTTDKGLQIACSYRSSLRFHTCKLTLLYWIYLTGRTETKKVS